MIWSVVAIFALFMIVLVIFRKRDDFTDVLVFGAFFTLIVILVLVMLISEVSS